MRVLDEQIGRLHINYFHNRIQYVLKDRRRSLWITHNYWNGYTDCKHSEKHIHKAKMRAAFQKAVNSKKAAKMPYFFPPAVLEYVTSEYGLEPVLEMDICGFKPGVEASVLSS